MRRTVFFAVSWMLAAAGWAAGADENAAPVKHVIPTVTRTVLQFSTLENQWNDAVQLHDAESVKKLLAPGFELRSAAVPGRPTPRDESVALSLRDEPFVSTVTQMAVHEYGDTVVVSFLWNLEVAKSSPLAQQIFVVDTWKRVDGNWLVSARYAAPLAGAVKKVPGADMSEPTIKKKI